MNFVDIKSVFSSFFCQSQNFDFQADLLRVYICSLTRIINTQINGSTLFDWQRVFNSRTLVSFCFRKLNNSSIISDSQQIFDFSSTSLIEDAVALARISNRSIKNAGHSLDAQVRQHSNIDSPQKNCENNSTAMSSAFCIRVCWN